MIRRNFNRAVAITLLVGIAITPLCCYSSTVKKSTTTTVVKKVQKSIEKKVICNEKQEGVGDVLIEESEVPAPTNIVIIKDEIITNLPTEEEIISIQKNNQKSTSKSEQSNKPKQKKSKEYKVSSSVRFGEDEMNMLYRIVEAEDGSQDIENKMDVCNVILNRVKSPKFPNTIEKVIFERGQFSPISDGRYWSVSISDYTRKAVDKALSEADTTFGALFFCERSIIYGSTARWFDSMNCTKKNSSGHYFYK